MNSFDAVKDKEVTSKAKDSNKKRPVIVVVAYQGYGIYKNEDDFYRVFLNTFLPYNKDMRYEARFADTYEEALAYGKQKVADFRRWSVSDIKNPTYKYNWFELIS